MIVDEEHDAAYKSDRTPRFQARDAAARARPDRRRRGRPRERDAVGREHGPRAVRDGTAAPCCRRGRPGPSPGCRAVDMRAELAAGNRGLLSDALAAALAGARCRARRPRDPRHQPPRHGVGRRVPRLRPRPGLPRLRPAARVPPRGDVAALPPLRPCLAAGDALSGVRVARASATWAAARSASSARSGSGSRRCGSAASTATSSSARAPPTASSTPSQRGRLDVLVGTSLVAKGLDVPEVTLVGVVSADIALNLPDERASERTYQLLAQAVGRAGRGDRPGTAFIQTYRPDHRAIRAVVEGDAAAFYDEELRTSGSGSGRPPSDASSS